MIVTLELQPEIERGLLAQAAARGVSLNDLVTEIVVRGARLFPELSGPPPNTGEAMLKIDGVWVHQGLAEPGVDWDRVVSDVRDERIADLLKASM
jgi:hypothetical protein